MQFIYFAPLIFTIAVSYVNAIQVTLPTGKVEGHTKESFKGVPYYAFEGIPYARPPVGKYRFEEPKPIKPWVATWIAKKPTTCLQYYHYTEPGDDWVKGDEDCLHINVYTKEVSPKSNLKDVIVFIHGGAFMFNSGGTYGERFLMDHDVVYVSLNYRLGPLGFLSLESRYLPGNNGLKDQLLALKWIKENVRSFGGNPDSITLSGMSAGGASVQLHILSPLSQNGLFNRAIIASGTALNPWVLTEKSREKATKLAEVVGCPVLDTKEMLRCLKYRPARQIVAAVKEFQPWRYNPFSPFGVVVDQWSDEPIVPEHPYKALKHKDVYNVPVLFSNVQAEGLYPGAEFLQDECLEQIDQQFNDLVPYILDFNNTVKPADILNVCQKIRSFYFQDRKISKETCEELIQMISDRLFLVDCERAARLHSAVSTEDSYFYYYSYRAARSKSNLRTKSTVSYGTSHADDTIMILSTPTNMTSTESDREMSEMLQNMWISFAKTGVPKIGKVSWEKMSTQLSDPLKYLHIKSPQQIAMESSESMGNRKEFWDSLPIMENQNLETLRDEL